MKALLLTLDFINDITHPKGKIARYADRIERNQTIERANQAIAHVRQNNWPIAHVRVGFDATYAQCPKHSPMFGPAAEHRALQLDSWGTAFHDKLAHEQTDTIITQHRVSAFYNTGLEALLRAQHIDTLGLCGVATNMAVEHTARDAHDRDYRVVILTDACKAANDAANQATMVSLARFTTQIPVAEIESV